MLGRWVEETRSVLILGYTLLSLEAQSRTRARLLVVNSGPPSTLPLISHPRFGRSALLEELQPGG